jgi:hypothetical protein
MNSQLADTSTFNEALICASRSAEIPESADAYGWLVGSWELDVLHYWAEDVSARGLKAEVHAAWTLDGLAVQDVWIMPPRPERARIDRDANMYGTTLRVWDRRIQAWRISWHNPAGGHFEEQVGRRNGNDVIQIGMRPGGTPTRWSFKEITADSFHWLGESFTANGKAWILEGEFRARRIG